MFVNRNLQGAIVGAAEEPQDGWVNEALPETDPELQAYLNPPVRDWDGFLEENMGLLMTLLEAAPSTIAANFLQIEFGKRPAIDVGRLRTYWNAAIVTIPPTAEQVATLQDSAARFNLPIQLTSTGAIA